MLQNQALIQETLRRGMDLSQKGRLRGATCFVIGSSLRQLEAVCQDLIRLTCPVEMALFMTSPKR